MNNTRSLHRMAAAALALGCLGAAAGCSHLKRDVEYNLLPVRARAVAEATEHPAVRVELIDISRHGRDDYLIVRVRVHNQSAELAHFEPKQLILVTGAQVTQASEEYKENDVTRADVDSLELPSTDLGGGDGDDDDDDDDDDSGSDGGGRDSSGSRSHDHGDRDMDGDGGALGALDPAVLGDAVGHGAEWAARGALGAAAGTGEAITATVQAGKFVIEGTYFVLKGSVLLARGINDVIETGIQKARQRIEPGRYSELAVKFDHMPAKSEMWATYLFFQDAVTLESGYRPALPPLIITNPQETHMGFAPPRRARLAAGLRIGGGGTWTSSETANARKFLGLQGYIGPRVGPWSFTAMGAAGSGFVLGFDVRRDIVANGGVLSTAYLGYGRHWLMKPEGESGLLDGRGARVGVEIMVPFSQRAYDWEVVTGGLGIYLEAAPLVMDDGTGVHITGGMSLLGF